MVMDFIVKDLDSNYRLDAFHNKADKIIFEISSVILMHIPQNLRIRSEGTERHSALN